MTLSLSLPDISSSARANFVCAEMIVMSGLAQTLEQLACFPALFALSRIFALFQNKLICKARTRHLTQMSPPLPGFFAKKGVTP